MWIRCLNSLQCAEHTKHAFMLSIPFFSKWARQSEVLFIAYCPICAIAKGSQSVTGQLQRVQHLFLVSELEYVCEREGGG